MCRVQVAVLVERARLGDFDEVASSTELLNYVSPPLQSGEAPPAGTDSGFSEAGEHASRAGEQAGRQPAPQQAPPSSGTMQRSVSPGGVSLAATFGSAPSDSLLAADSAHKPGAATVCMQTSPGGPPAEPAQSERATSRLSTVTLPASSSPTKGADDAHSSDSAADAGLQAAGVRMPVWSAEERSQAAVQAAVDLHGKLAVARGLPDADVRRPLWLAAIAIKATQTGIDAVQGACTAVQARESDSLEGHVWSSCHAASMPSVLTRA